MKKGTFCCPVVPKPQRYHDLNRNMPLKNSTSVRKLSSFQSNGLSIEVCSRADAFIIIGTYQYSPITVVQCRTKIRLYYAMSILFRPHNTIKPAIWWRRRVPPPGPQRLLHAPFIVIVTSLQHNTFSIHQFSYIRNTHHKFF